MSDCERCADLTSIIGRLEASNADLGAQMAQMASGNAKTSTDATIAELRRQLDGMQAQLRSAGSRETMLRTELNRLREEEPDSAQVKALLVLWRDEVKGGDKKIKIDLAGPRGKKVKWALKKYGDERCRTAILGAKLDDWAMGRHPKIRNSGKTFNDIAKHILLDEETIERFEGLWLQRANQRPTPADFPSGPTGVQALLEKLEQVREVKPGQWSARCPAHEDRTPSLSVGQGHKGAVVHCHVGCTADDIAAAAGVPLASLFDPDTDVVPRPAPKPPSPLPTGDRVIAWRDALQARPAVLQRLHELRLWSPETLKTLGVGIDGDRLTIPVTDEDGHLVNVMRYKPVRKGDEPKMLPFAPGHGRNLFPAPEGFPGDIWLVEGEPDAVTGCELGLPVVAVPGTNKWQDEWAERFMDRVVYVCFDCDDITTPPRRPGGKQGPKGREAAQRIAAALLPTAREVRIVDLDPVRNDGFDVSDLLRERPSSLDAATHAGLVAQTLRKLAADSGAVLRMEGRAA